jgi:Phosphatidylethanolamine-binding protein.
MKLHLLAAVAALVLAAEPAAAFEVDFDFSNVRPCAGGSLRITPSPEFRLNGVPEGTALLDFRLHDLTADIQHGGKALDYQGEPAVAADSFKYVGPCPIRGTHTYEWTVRALDDAGGELGVTTAQGEFTATRP